jgi:hypothetical protein
MRTAPIAVATIALHSGMRHAQYKAITTASV